MDKVIFYSKDTIHHIDSDDQYLLKKQVKDRFRSTTTPYIRQLMAQSDAIRKQFKPSFYEGLNFGKEEAFEEGKHNSGIYGLERVYEDRAVLTPYFACASYCRYCFKKTRTLAGNGEKMTDQNITAAIEYIKNDPRISTALITGGDPLAKPKLLFKILDQLVDIPHISKIRVGTRHILFQPQKITDELASRIASYNYVDPFHPMRSKNISIGLSINHPDELQPEVISAVDKFTKRGLSVRSQIVLMKGINDQTQTLKELLDHLLVIGVTPYYLFHCMDVIGTPHMRTTVQKGLDILQELSEFSGYYAMPYVYVTPVGKHRISAGHKLNYEIIDGKRYIKTTSPYKTQNFFEFTGKKELPPRHETDANGYIISRYLDGDDTQIHY